MHLGTLPMPESEFDICEGCDNEWDFVIDSVSDDRICTQCGLVSSPMNDISRDISLAFPLVAKSVSTRKNYFETRMYAILKELGVHRPSDEIAIAHIHFKRVEARLASTRHIHKRKSMMCYGFVLCKLIEYMRWYAFDNIPDSLKYPRMKKTRESVVYDWEFVMFPFGMDLHEDEHLEFFST